MKFGLNSSEWGIITKLVLEPLKAKNASVWVYGSRARGDYQTYSDLDLLYRLPKSLNLSELAVIQEKLENSSLTIKVDLAYEEDITSGYLQSIIQDRVSL